MSATIVDMMVPLYSRIFAFSIVSVVVIKTLFKFFLTLYDFARVACRISAGVFGIPEGRVQYATL